MNAFYSKSWQRMEMTVQANLRQSYTAAARMCWRGGVRIVAASLLHKDKRYLLHEAVAQAIAASLVNVLSVSQSHCACLKVIDVAMRVKARCLVKAPGSESEAFDLEY